MRLPSSAIAFAVNAALVTAQAGTNTSSPAASKTSPDPCAVVSAHAVSYLSANPQASSALLKPSEVYACLRTVPYDKSKDTDQIAWIQNLLQFQSTLTYLKDPPLSYPLPAVDLPGGLNNISDTITSGNYTNEYDIELDVYNLINSAHDGHLAYTPFLVGAFAYRSGVSLASVSLDGLAEPKIYITSDIITKSNASFTPSAVTSINGQDVKYLTELGQGMQDLDALYNSAVYSPATAGFGDGVGATAGGLFTQHSDQTVCTFENSTSKTFNASATIAASSVKSLPASGQGYFEFLTPTGSNSTSNTTSPAPLPKPLGPNYPMPVINHNQSLVSGFFLNGTEDSDVAVLNVASFDAKTDAAILQFAQDASLFLAKCKSAGKTRLIIDVRNNPGGVVPLGFALFQQLFPNTVPYSGVRMRDSEAENALGLIASSSPVPNNPASPLAGSVFNVFSQTGLSQPNGTSFDSWEQFYGPLHQHGDVYSEVGSWDYDDSATGSALAFVTGGNVTKLPPQVFPSESITLLTDGQCSSTCAVFANLMISQGHVKTVTVGGRPNNQPMAVIGGVQGGEVLELPALVEYATEAIAVQANATGNSSTQAAQVRGELQWLASPPPIISFTGGVSVNLLDSIAQNDTTMTPLQFSGGIPADCRFYYMPADISSVANTWARVAKGVKADGNGLCINGTMTGVSGSNGSAPLPFRGSASALGPANLVWTMVLVALGSVATMFI